MNDTPRIILSLLSRLFLHLFSRRTLSAEMEACRGLEEKPGQLRVTKPCCENPTNGFVELPISTQVARVFALFSNGCAHLQPSPLMTTLTMSINRQDHCLPHEAQPE